MNYTAERRWRLAAQAAKTARVLRAENHETPAPAGTAGRSCSSTGAETHPADHPLRGLALLLAFPTETHETVGVVAHAGNAIRAQTLLCWHPAPTPEQRRPARRTRAVASRDPAPAGTAGRSRSSAGAGPHPAGSPTGTQPPSRRSPPTGTCTPPRIQGEKPGLPRQQARLGSGLWQQPGKVVIKSKCAGIDGIGDATSALIARAKGAAGVVCLQNRRQGFLGLTLPGALGLVWRYHNPIGGKRVESAVRSIKHRGCSPSGGMDE